jgi:hypothetical protein
MNNKILTLFIFRILPIIFTAGYIKMLLDLDSNFIGGVVTIIGLIFPLIGLFLWMLGDKVYESQNFK